MNSRGLSSTVENYLKALYSQRQELGSRLVPLGKLAEGLGVTPGSATAMIKRLAADQLVEYEPRTGARLSDRGRSIALQVLRRHRLVELFLVQVVGFDWDEVHEEAEVLEHVISDRMLARIDEMLGYPTVDPHGDPIPDASGELIEPDLVSLAERAPGTLKIARVSDQNPAFLRFLDEHGLTPGTEIEIVRRDELADLLEIRRSDDAAIVRIGISAARRILVRDGPSRDQNEKV
ncbi:MAG: metal-dependent transcriptional regulator [Planctomycetes bacterium]|nr:metal-dependent transcriptional regulator [Planctomycetota bacterium]